MNHDYLDLLSFLREQELTLWTVGRKWTKSRFQRPFGRKIARGRDLLPSQAKPPVGVGSELALGVLVEPWRCGLEGSRPVTQAQSLAHKMAGAWLDLSREWEKPFKMAE